MVSSASALKNADRLSLLPRPSAITRPASAASRRSSCGRGWCAWMRGGEGRAVSRQVNAHLVKGKGNGGRGGDWRAWKSHNDETTPRIQACQLAPDASPRRAPSPRSRSPPPVRPFSAASRPPQPSQRARAPRPAPRRAVGPGGRVGGRCRRPTPRGGRRGGAWRPSPPLPAAPPPPPPPVMAPWGGSTVEHSRADQSRAKQIRAERVRRVRRPSSPQHFENTSQPGSQIGQDAVHVSDADSGGYSCLTYLLQPFHLRGSLRLLGRDSVGESLALLRRPRLVQLQQQPLRLRILRDYRGVLCRG